MSPVRLAVGLLLLLGIVPALIVGYYDREDPSLWGFPFYFWFQFLLVPITAALTYAAYKLLQRDEQR